ncbi:MAG: hypothetical protein EZS28_020753 [Streblomastix strix]|uniref:Uncharacterized protein n=1 Tax=Streblomastix strix TaxID=222440 RepID=A0A5J4VMI6_9EUKA|nr:MAG: hypothetical protein EZS28_020753 [Streblomastix strix]
MDQGTQQLGKNQHSFSQHWAANEQGKRHEHDLAKRWSGYNAFQWRHTKAVVSDAGQIDLESNNRFENEFQELDPHEGMEPWMGFKLADAARMMALRFQKNVPRAKHSATSATTQDHVLDLNEVPRDMQSMKRKRDEIQKATQFALLERPGIK